MKETKFALGSLVITAALVALVTTSMKSNTLKAVPVHDVRAADGTPKSFVGQRLRMVGFVTHDPVRRSTAASPSGTVDVAHFVVEDKGRVVNVTYPDALPDTFRAGGPVQVDGVYKAPGVIDADHVLTKCPSKYDQIKPALKQKAKASSPVESAQTASHRPISTG